MVSKFARECENIDDFSCPFRSIAHAGVEMKERPAMKHDMPLEGSTEDSAATVQVSQLLNGLPAENQWSSK